MDWPRKVIELSRFPGSFIENFIIESLNHHSLTQRWRKAAHEELAKQVIGLMSHVNADRCFFSSVVGRRGSGKRAASEQQWPVGKLAQGERKSAGAKETFEEVLPVGRRPIAFDCLRSCGCEVMIDRPSQQAS